jgi:RNA polymerase sigma-70 factor (ECF subfamily)
MDELCHRYWKPVYCYLRAGWSKTNEDAKDLTQAFFIWLMEGEGVSRYKPEMSGFRTFLKVLLRHFMGHHEDALKALKRGGGTKIVALEGALPSLENVLKDEKAPDPERVFDHTWKTELVHHAMARAREQFRSRGQADYYRVFEEYDLLPETDRSTYDDLAAKFGMKGREVEHILAVVRKAIRDEMRAELEAMVLSPSEVEEEWNALLGP